MAPGSIFHHISFRSTILQSFIFRSINQKTQKHFIFCLVLSIFIRSHICKWPWRDWQPLYCVGCKCLIVCAGASIGGLRVSPTGLIPWFSNWGKFLSPLCCITLSFSREKSTQAQEVAKSCFLPQRPPGAWLIVEERGSHGGRVESHDESLHRSFVANGDVVLWCALKSRERCAMDMMCGDWTTMCGLFATSSITEKRRRKSY